MTDDEELGEQKDLLGHKPASFEHAIVRHSFDQAVIRVARLAAVGESGLTASLISEVTMIQAQLAVDDLISLAISLRRLVDNLDLKSAAQNYRVPRIKVLRRTDNTIEGTIVIGQASMSTLLNKLVHSSRVEVLGFHYQFLLDLEFEKLVPFLRNLDPQRMRPIAVVKADDVQYVFHVGALCEGASRLLNLAIEAASDSGLYLETELE